MRDRMQAYGPKQISEAIDLAQRTLNAEDSPVSERVLARHILALATLTNSFLNEPQPEPATTPGQIRRRYACDICGEIYPFNTVLEAFIIHRGDQADHPLTVLQEGGVLVVTHNTVREMLHPSQVTDRDETGPNDPFRQ